MHRPDDANDAFEGSSGFEDTGGAADPRAERLWLSVEALKRAGGPEDDTARDLPFDTLPALLPSFPYQPHRADANGTNGNGHHNGYVNGNGNGHGAAGSERDLNELAALAALVYRAMQTDAAEVARTCPTARARLEDAIHEAAPLHTGEAVAASAQAAGPAARRWWRALVPAWKTPAQRGARDRRLVLACMLLTGLCAIALALWVRSRVFANDAAGGGAAFVGGATAQPAAARSLSLPGKQCK